MGAGSTFMETWEFSRSTENLCGVAPTTVSLRTGSSTQNDRLEALSMYSAISGRYTHRVAISNHRLISFADGEITFRWRDSYAHREQKLLSLSLDKFLRRFLLHVLPKGFRCCVRHFGFLANHQTCHHLATLLSVARLGATSHARSRHFQRCLALSQVRWADAGHRNVYSC